MKAFVKEITWLPGSETGWGNGYVCIPSDHPLYGLDYDQIHTLMPDLDVHGGLTFASKSEECKDWVELPEGTKENHWIIGFDCAHYNDNQINRPRAFVELEAQNLARQIEAYQPIEN